LETKL